MNWIAFRRITWGRALIAGLVPSRLRNCVLVAVTAAGVSAQGLHADVVFVTARPQPAGSGPNTSGGYSEINLNLGDSSAKGTAPGRPAVTGSRAYLATTNLADTTAGFNLTPALGVSCGIYRIEHNFNSSVGNVSTDVVISATCAGGSLSFTSTDKFQSRYGDPNNVWQVLGLLTNTTATPTIAFRYASGTVNASTANRLVIDCFRLSDLPTCLMAPPPSVNGPLVEGQTQVSVAGVVSNAIAVSVYQDTGAGMGLIGQKTSGLVPGANSVPVTPLAKGARVSATQTLLCGGESCVPNSGPIVEAGSLSIRLTGGKLVLDWPGAHDLQTSVNLGGTYTNVPNGTLSPYTNNFTETQRFFRLGN